MTGATDEDATTEEDELTTLLELLISLLLLVALEEECCSLLLLLTLSILDVFDEIVIGSELDSYFWLEDVVSITSLLLDAVCVPQDIRAKIANELNVNLKSFFTMYSF